MIQLADTDARRQALESDDVTVAVLLTVGFPTQVGGTQRYTDAARDLDVGGETYESTSYLRALSPPSSEFERDLAEVGFLDPLEEGRTTFRHMFTFHGWTGIAISVDVVFVADDGTVSLPLNVYKGRCVSIVESFSDGVPLTTARFAGPLVKLDTEASIVTSDAQQRMRSATDTSMKFAHVARDIAWGRKITNPASAGGGSPGSGTRTGPTR